ncbi:hypothetical protein DCC79_15740 [bacterium]|nr:MAG: hypothetical protein DCC79_15740 [bacterium]
MVPYEYVMLLLWMTFAVVGITRHFPRELGATIGFVGMMFFFQLLGSKVDGMVFKVASGLGAGSESESLVSWCFYSGTILAVVVIMYAGETLTFGGEWPPTRIGGIVIDATMGLVNGWIVIGTWWYYTHKLGYPQQALGVYQPPLSDQAQVLVALTPLELIPSGQATLVLGGALLGLLFLKVAR